MSAADTEGIGAQIKRGVPRLYIWGGRFRKGILRRFTGLGSRVEAMTSRIRLAAFWRVYLLTTIHLADSPRKRFYREG